MPRPAVYDDDLRLRLVANAAGRIAAGGVAGLSLRRLASAERTSTNAVYTLFGSKDELVAAVLEEAVRGFMAAQESVGRSGDAVADLTALGLAYRSWVLDNPALYAVLMGSRTPHVPGVGIAGGAWSTHRSAEPLLDGVRRAIDAGQLVADDAEQVATTLWAGVHGMVTLEVALWSDLPRAERDDRFAEHVYSLACRWIPGHGPAD